VIPGGLVEAYGLRGCRLGCAGRCKKAMARGDGTVVPSPDCELMAGPPPLPGAMPLLTHHTEEQLRAMMQRGRDSDRDVERAASEELDRRARV
jgi:hypothetical protein